MGKMCIRDSGDYHRKQWRACSDGKRRNPAGEHDRDCHAENVRYHGIVCRSGIRSCLLYTSSMTVIKQKDYEPINGTLYPVVPVLVQEDKEQEKTEPMPCLIYFAGSYQKLSLIHISGEKIFLMLWRKNTVNF